MDDFKDLLVELIIEVIDLLPPKPLIDRILKRMNPSELCHMIESYLDANQLEDLYFQRNSGIDIC